MMSRLYLRAWHINCGTAKAVRDIGIAASEQSQKFGKVSKSHTRFEGGREYLS